MLLGYYYKAWLTVDVPQNSYQRCWTGLRLECCSSSFKFVHINLKLFSPFEQVHFKKQEKELLQAQCWNQY